jgi:hypothetical protein
MTRFRKLFVTPVLAIAAAAAAPLSASAETAYELRSAILKCEPSCYEKQHFEGPAKKIKVCASLAIHFTQDRRGKGWAKLERSSAMSPKAVPGCKFPTSVPARWKAVVAEARKQLDLTRGDFVTVAPDFGDWRYEKDDLGRVTARDVLVDHYSRGQEAYDGCRAGDPFAVCEGENNEVTSFNQLAYRVTEAKHLKKEGKDKDCRAAAWDAVRQAVDVRHERDYWIKDGSWKVKTYATRHDGVLSEKEMYARTDALDAEAHALWADCGGKGDVPPDK